MQKYSIISNPPNISGNNFKKTIKFIQHIDLNQDLCEVFSQKVKVSNAGMQITN
uniref:Uncharacterized protein n=1 Tax=Prevotella sp. GTC17259 TaxID=3236795 RepID=A0AB33J8J1_9BACT